MDSSLSNDMPVKDYELVQCPALMPAAYKRALRILAERHGIKSSQIIRQVLTAYTQELYPEFTDILAHEQSSLSQSNT